jgi:hypothetical protein
VSPRNGVRPEALWQHTRPFIHKYREGPRKSKAAQPAHVHSMSGSISDERAAGFELLCATNSSFLPFKRSILSRASLEFDRGQCTEEQATKLERTLSSLFCLLVPYFMAPAATAVLEYLMRKYRYVSVALRRPCVGLLLFLRQSP